MNEFQTVLIRRLAIAWSRIQQEALLHESGKVPHPTHRRRGKKIPVTQRYVRSSLWRKWALWSFLGTRVHLGRQWNATSGLGALEDRGIDLGS